MNSEWQLVDVVRVFTDEDGGFGNELGIVESSERTRDREQQLAAALGFSETVFVDDVTEARARIRIFTPAGELPFAGHPSVGVAWWFAQRGIPVVQHPGSAIGAGRRQHDRLHRQRGRRGDGGWRRRSGRVDQAG